MKKLFVAGCCLIAGMTSSYAQLSCASPGKNGNQTISGVVNTYYPGNTASLIIGAVSVSIGAGKGAGEAIASGDLLLIVQMQGADIVNTDDNNYGTGLGTAKGYRTSGGNFYAGQFEYVKATNNVAVTGGTLSFSPMLTKKYVRRDYVAGTNGRSRYQIIKVPQYNDATLSGNITAYKWDGEVGGVIALDVLSVLYFNGFTINAAASGFRGGGGRSLAGDGGANTSYRTTSSVNNNGQKGESIAGTPAYVWNGTVGSANVISTGSEGYPNGSSSRGAPANGGGGGQDGNPGGNDQNAGGGGGGNGGAGGTGGNSWSSNLPTGGVGGDIFAQAAITRMIMGGGGGAGSGNNSATNPDALSGGVGGGMVFIKARTIAGTGTITVDGQNAQNSRVDCCDDGAGGGGAGGSVLFTAYNTAGMASITVSAKGGKGGNTSGNATAHGPGGGGGGGVIYTNGTLAGASVAGGANGTTTGSSAYNSTAGANGIFDSNTANDPTSAYAGYKCAFPLPARYFNLTGKLQNSQVQLEWKTILELNTDHFEIERSRDNREFSRIGNPVKASGNTPNEKLYNYPDNISNANFSDVLYYRVKLVDMDGKVTYSNTITIRLTAIQETTAWPNPFTESISISINGTQDQNFSFRFLDYTGREILQKKEFVAKGYNQVTLGGLSRLPKGIYLLCIRGEQSLEMKQVKVVKN